MEVTCMKKIIALSVIALALGLSACDKKEQAAAPAPAVDAAAAPAADAAAAPAADAAAAPAADAAAPAAAK